MYAVENPSVDDTDVDRNAISVSCHEGDGYHGYILYDPVWFSGLRTPQGENWPKYFVVAHEIAHHLNGNTIKSAGVYSRDAEVDADRWAARTLAKMKVPLNDILNALDLLDHPKIDGDYPTRCERRQEIILAYSKESSSSGHAYQVCGGCWASDGTMGYYLRRSLGPGARIEDSDVLGCGNRMDIDVPRRSFKEDLFGMCALPALSEGTLLTWQNIRICQVQHR
jgi:hypothetical protein